MQNEYQNSHCCFDASMAVNIGVGGASIPWSSTITNLPLQLSERLEHTRIRVTGLTLTGLTFREKLSDSVKNHGCGEREALRRPKPLMHLRRFMVNVPRHHSPRSRTHRGLYLRRCRSSPTNEGCIETARTAGEQIHAKLKRWRSKCRHLGYSSK
jgi:hypothetical protein